MRDIKFRAWEMNAIKGWFYFGVEGIPRCYEDSIDYTLLHQYTGLKDKNGVEIYEGDVVRIEKCFTNGIDTLSDHIGEVKYTDGLRFMAIDEYLNSISPYEYKDRIEVIGNIYENPELL